ncbi:MAG: response regulator [Acetatifactor sp.]|nr:response regulator [Acetatifactor sp.]
MSENYGNYNISFLVTGVVVYALLLVIQFSFSSTKRVREKIFVSIVTTGLLSSLAQFATVETERNYFGPGKSVMVSFLMMFQFFFTVTMAICFYNFVAECAGVRGKRERRINETSLWLSGMFVIWNFLAKSGIILTKRVSQNVNTVSILFYLIPMFIYFYGTHIIIKNRNKFEKKMFFAVLTFLLFPVMAGIIQYFMPNQLLMVYGSAMSTLILFFELEIPNFEKLIEARISLEESSREEMKAKEKAIEDNEAKNQFLANATQDLKKPIASILTLNEILLRRTKERSTSEYALKIRTSVNALSGLIGDILIYSKIESGKIEIHNEEYSPAELIQEVYMENLSLATSKGIGLTLDIDENLPDILYGDSRRLKRIVKNLVDNGVSFTDRGEVKLSIKESHVNISGGEDQASDNYGRPISLRFEISDTGTGIKEEDLDRLFVAFDKLEIKGAYSSEGAGLGLCIAYSLLKLMGSRLMIESVFGVGSRMYFDLPQRALSNDRLGNIDEYIEARKIKYTGQEHFEAPDSKILVVDDSEINRFVIEKFLKPTKAAVTAVSSGRECLDILERESFDLILMDHMMPEMDGIETRQRMSFMDGLSTVPIVAMTACSSADEKKMFLELGFNDFLAKPISQEELLSTVKRLLPGVSDQ